MLWFIVVGLVMLLLVSNRRESFVPGDPMITVYKTRGLVNGYRFTFNVYGNGVTEYKDHNTNIIHHGKVNPERVLDVLQHGKAVDFYDSYMQMRRGALPRADYPEEFVILNDTHQRHKVLIKPEVMTEDEVALVHKIHAMILETHPEAEYHLEENFPRNMHIPMNTQSM